MEHNKLKTLFIHYVAAKKILHKLLGNEVDVTDEEFDRWLIDGEIRARLTSQSLASIVTYRYLRYGSEISPPIHDPKTFVLLDELCRYYYSQDELQQFIPSTRWLTCEQWIERWIKLGSNRQEAESLIRACFHRAIARDNFESAWTKPPLVAKPLTMITALDTGETVYYTNTPFLTIGRIDDEYFGVAENGIYKLNEDDFFHGVCHFAEKQFFSVEEQWYCKKRADDADEWITEPCESPLEPKHHIVITELFSLNVIKQIEHEYFPGILIPTSKPEQADTKTSAKNTIAAEKNCQEWLTSIMSENSIPEKPKAQYKVEAQKTFPGISIRGFMRAWGNALSETGNANWAKPGRKS